jgi:hypothetical protein
MIIVAPPENESLNSAKRIDFNALLGSQVEGCSKIIPSDLDGVVERCGSLLIIEAKKRTELPVKPPQELALSVLASKTGIIVLVVKIEDEKTTSVGNETFQPLGYRKYEHDEDGAWRQTQYISCDLQQFKVRYDDWLRAATARDEAAMRSSF